MLCANRCEVHADRLVVVVPRRTRQPLSRHDLESRASDQLRVVVERQKSRGYAASNTASRTGNSPPSPIAKVTRSPTPRAAVLRAVYFASGWMSTPSTEHPCRSASRHAPSPDPYATSSTRDRSSSPKRARDQIDSLRSARREEVLTSVDGHRRRSFHTESLATATSLEPPTSIECHACKY